MTRVIGLTLMHISGFQEGTTRVLVAHTKAAKDIFVNAVLFDPHPEQGEDDIMDEADIRIKSLGWTKARDMFFKDIEAQSLRDALFEIISG